MTAPETPREKALRLWEEAGYVVAAADDLDVYDPGAFAAVVATDVVVFAAYEAGRARYKREHP